MKNVNVEPLNKVHCLVCDNVFNEGSKIINVCPYCGNKDMKQTVYMSSVEDTIKCMINDWWISSKSDADCADFEMHVKTLLDDILLLIDDE